MDQLPYDLNGRVALITDANHGIGAAAEALASCGAALLAASWMLAGGAFGCAVLALRQYRMPA